MVQTQNKNLIPDIEYDSLRSWIRLILLFIVGVVGIVGMWSVVVVMPALETEFAIDRGKASLLYATTMVGFGLGNFLIGKVVDKFGLKFPEIDKLEFFNSLSKSTVWSNLLTSNSFNFGFEIKILSF